MRQLYINQFEKIISQDINDLQMIVAKGVADDIFYPYFGKASGNLNGSFAPTYTGALTLTLLKGVGFLYDSSQIGYVPKYRMIRATADISVTLGAANGSNPRIDLVCLTPNFAVTATASRKVKTGGVGPIVDTIVNKVIEDTYTLTVVAGTPAASPVAPATPAGSLAICTCLVHTTTGMGSQADISTVMSPLVQPSTATSFQRFVSPSGYGTDATIASALAALSSTGGVITIMENISLPSGVTISVANIEIKGMPQATITGSGGGGITINASGCKLSGLRLSTFSVAVSINNGMNNCFVTGNRFASCTSDVVDSNTTPNNVIANNISE